MTDCAGRLPLEVAIRICTELTRADKEKRDGEGQSGVGSLTSREEHMARDLK